MTTRDLLPVSPKPISGPAAAPMRRPIPWHVRRALPTPALSVTLPFASLARLYRRAVAHARVSLAAAVERFGERQTGTSSIRCRRVNSRQMRHGRAASHSETLGAICKRTRMSSGYIRPGINALGNINRPVLFDNCRRRIQQCIFCVEDALRSFAHVQGLFLRLSESDKEMSFCYVRPRS